MKKLNLITFASVLQKQDKNIIRNSHKELFENLEKNYAVDMILNDRREAFLSEKEHEGLTVVFIATGGTEGIVVADYDKLPKPMVLLTDGKANSLAASLELSCWVRQKKEECKIIHGSMDYVLEELRKLEAKPKKCTLLEGKRIGVIGEPSDWLVASDVDYAAAKERWGVEYVDIALNRVEHYYTQEEGTDAGIDNFINNAAGCIEPTREDIVKAYRLYKALRRLANEEHLDALTLQCFSLIPTTKTTGCLALALLNDSGVVAGCEGDLQSIFTLLLAKEATGVDGFMANPAHINIEDNTLIIAHCTIGLKQTRKYIIRSHFESLSGVAIQGILNEGDITVVKFGGKDLSRRVVLTGHIVENQDDPNKCRTQLLIKFDNDSPVSYFLENTIGNHHIVLQGNHRKALESC